MYSVEPIERGPKFMDRSSAEYDGWTAEKEEMLRFLEHQKLLSILNNRGYTEQDIHQILVAVANGARRSNTNSSLLDNLDELANTFGEGL